MFIFCPSAPNFIPIRILNCTCYICVIMLIKRLQLSLKIPGIEIVLPQPYCIRIIGSIVVMGEELSVKLDFILSPQDPAPIS